MSIPSDLEELREIFQNARKAAFTQMILVPEDKVKEIMDRIVRDFPIEFEQASEIVKKSKDILDLAQSKANELSPDQVEGAKKEAEEIIRLAHTEAEKMKTQTLAFIQKIIADSLISVRKADSILQESLEGVKNADL
jgi:hypothetical protein